MRFFLKNKEWFENFYTLNKLTNSIHDDRYPDFIQIDLDGQENSFIVCYNLNHYYHLRPNDFGIEIFKNDDIYLVDLDKNKKKEFKNFCLENNIEFND